MRLLMAVLIGLSLAWTSAAAGERDPEDLPDPAKVVEETANDIIRILRENRDELAEDPEHLYELVEEKMLPVFDIPYSTRLVMGRHGRDASPEQRQAFGEALYRFLVRNYAEGLLEYSDEDIEVRPVRGTPDPDRQRIRTTIVRPGASDVPVDYTMRYTDDGWKVFDVTIEGVSYVTNYRNSFDREIREQGLDAVIERLERRADRKAEELEESLEEREEENGEENGDDEGN